MKVLSFGTLYFKLPDDFDGGLSAALRAFADYHDSVTDTPQQRIGGKHVPSSEKTAAEYVEETWDEFWETIHESGCRVHGVVGIADYPDDGEGVHLDLNTGVPADFVARVNAAQDEILESTVRGNEVLSPEMAEKVKPMLSDEMAKNARAALAGPVEEAVRQMRETLEGIRDNENLDMKDREIARNTLEGMDAIAAGEVPLPHPGSADWPRFPSEAPDGTP